MSGETNSRRATRLMAPRQISDADHGTLGEIQRKTCFTVERATWDARDTTGAHIGTFATSRSAINALCDKAGIARWFPRSK